MYSVSADYLTALSAPVKKFRLTGSVGSVSFTQANIIENTFSIVNRVSEGSEVKLGSVYIGQLKATFTGLNIARGAWLGKVITVSEGLQLADESFEDVPLGIYTIAEANHTQEGVEVVAYDNMNKLDKRFGVGQTNGSPYALLSMACTACSLTLGMTENQIRALTNGTATLYLYDANDIETYRDFVSWIAQTLCAVATISRDGKLVLRQYSITSAATIDENHRFMGCSFSDYAVKYTGCYVTIQEEGLARYAGASPDDGLTVSLGANPFMQLTGGELLQQNLINAFATVSLVPFSATMLGGAIYDLCDCLTFSGGIANGAVVGIMSYAYSYNRGYKIEGYGKNPDLANARSKTDKDITGLIGEIDTDKPRIFAYTNADAITIADGGEQTVAYIHVVAKKGTRLALQLECNHTAVTTETETATAYTNTDLLITSKIYVNNVQESFSPVETEQDGKQGLFVTHSFTVDEGGTEIQIDLACAGGNISVAVGDIQAYVIGMGLTDFVMTDLELRHLPTNLFNYGTVNYYGLVINGVYNDSSTIDKTDDCTITPAEGVAIAGDAETVSFTATYEDFEVEFDAPVNSVFTFLRQNQGLVWASQYAGDIRDTSGGVLSTKSKVTQSQSAPYTKTYTLSYQGIDFDADHRPTYSSRQGSWSSVYEVSTSARVGITEFGTKELVFCSLYDLADVKYFDYDTLSGGSMPIVIHDDPDYSGSRTVTKAWIGDSGYIYELDGFLIFERFRLFASDSGSSHSGWAYGIVTNGTLDIYFKQNSDAYFSNNGVIKGDKGFKYVNGTVDVYQLAFDTTNLFTATKVTTLSGTGLTALSVVYLVDGTSDLFVLTDYTHYCTADGADNWSVSVIPSYNSKIRYISDKDVFVYFDSDDTLTYHARIPLLYFSHDLVTWYRNGTLLPVGQLVALDGSYSSNLLENDGYIVGTCFNWYYDQVGFSVSIDREI
jgi:hypothetical protein